MRKKTKSRVRVRFVEQCIDYIRGAVADAQDPATALGTRSRIIDRCLLVLKTLIETPALKRYVHTRVQGCFGKR